MHAMLVASAGLSANEVILSNVKIMLFSLTIIFSLYCASSFDVSTSSGEICFGLSYHFHSYLGLFHQLCSRLAS